VRPGRQPDIGGASLDLAGTPTADTYPDTTWAGSPFMVDVGFSLGNSQDFGCS
jgi:hypothetical protein